MQNLTPLEIQKQTFTRALKGYHVDEVRGYLSLVAEEIVPDHKVHNHVGLYVTGEPSEGEELS